jgi:short subunit dehydrogenase-like uncharacterized protein
MSSPSVLLIGASGYVGRLVSDEMLRNRSRFSRLAILTVETNKSKFAKVKAEGMEIVLGPFDSVDSFQGM